MGGLILQLQQIQCPFCSVIIFRVGFWWVLLSLITFHRFSIVNTVVIPLL